MIPGEQYRHPRFTDVWFRVLHYFETPTHIRVKVLWLPLNMEDVLTMSHQKAREFIRVW